MLFHGRRVHFNDTLYNDCPFCLDLDKSSHIGEVGKGQSWRMGKRYFGPMYEGNVRIISKDDFRRYLRYNITNNQNMNIKSMIQKGLPRGFSNDNGLMYGIGLYNNHMKKFMGPCKGDSGGSLIVDDARDRKLMAGIVCGGIGCGMGFPAWYTKVSAYIDWICCIIEKMVELDYDYDSVAKVCTAVAEQ